MIDPIRCIIHTLGRVCPNGITAFIIGNLNAVINFQNAPAATSTI